MKKEIYKDKIRMCLEKNYLYFHLHENPIPSCCIVFKHSLSNWLCIKDFINTTVFKKRKKSIIFWLLLNGNVLIRIKEILQAAVQRIFLEIINHFVILFLATTIHEMSFGKPTKVAISIHRDNMAFKSGEQILFQCIWHALNIA